MPEQDSEKTEKATSKKREEARKKGQVARSKDVPFAAMLVSALVLALAFRKTGEGARELMRDMLQLGFGGEVTVADAGALFSTVSLRFLALAGPVMGAMLIASVLSNVAMVGFRFSDEALGPDFDRINPVEGFKRIFSLQSVMEFLKSALKVAVVGGLMYWLLKKMMPGLPLLMESDLQGIGDEWLKLSVRLLAYSTAAAVLLAAVDYFHQWRVNEKKLMMTKAEVREEMKQTEGDPLVKSRLRVLQREVARRRMMADVPKSDVIVTNPTHIAVALMYKPGMHAPRVVAKGAGVVAEKIKEVARQAGVTIYEDRPLARFLFKKVSIGGEIPVEMYHAVAEILAYIYRLGNRGHFVDGRA